MWKSYAQLCFCNSCGHAPFVSTLRRSTVHKNELRGPHSFQHTHAHCALKNPQTTRSAHSKKQKTVVPPYKQKQQMFLTEKSANYTLRTPNNKDRQQRKLRRNTQTNNTTIETKLCVATIHHKPKSRSANAKLPHAKCLTKLEIQQPHGCWIHKNVMCWRPHRPCGRRTTLTTKAAQQNHQYTRHCTNCAHRASTFN